MKKFFLIVLGCMISAFGISVFLLPNQLSNGGFAGIATIFYYFLKIPMSLTIIILNIPFFIWGYFKLGKNFIFKTIFATILYSVFIDLFSGVTSLTDDRFLASIYGGIFVGLGLSLIFKGGSSTGGTDLIAYIIQIYKRDFRISNVLVGLDVIVVFLNLIFFKQVEIGLYSTIAIVISGKMIDIVFEGINFSKMIYIISDKSEEISDKLLKDLDKGLTGFYGKGMYTQKDRTIIMSVTNRRNIINIKEVAKQIDPYAFIIITDAREVYGLGFK
jgi:uncharacterized membrane-anchored protein YitT (DUF2179 family)